MIKALASAVVGLAAAFIIASPAAAAPICNDDTVTAYGFTNSFASYHMDTSDFCDGTYGIVSINWSLGSMYVFYDGSGYGALLDGLYYATETAEITVTDGSDTDTFTLTVLACHDDTFPYSC